MRLALQACLYFVFFNASLCLFAQAPSVPPPAPAQTQAIAIVGGTVHVGNGKIINNGTVVFENGKIIAVGERSSIDTKNAHIENASGKEVYPGIIAANSAIGLNEIGAVRATNDFAEVGDLKPNVRAAIAYNTDSRVIPTVRSNGILLAQVVPQGGLMPGQSSIMQLDAWNWEDAIYKADNAIYCNWPSVATFTGWWAEQGGIEPNKKYMEGVNAIRTLLDEARAWCSSIDNNNTNTTRAKNLKLEALCPLFSGQKQIFVNANNIKEIIDAVNMAQNYGLKIVICGGSDAWMALDFLKTNKVPVVIARTHNLPNRPDEDIDQRFKLPKMLNDAGILFCLSAGAAGDAFWDMRNIPFEAGTAVAYGLTKEEALSAITYNAAKILGIDHQTGTIEVNKDANILIVSGDLLDMRSSKVEQAYISGRKIDLDNKQKALARKFAGKYNIVISE